MSILLVEGFDLYNGIGANTGLLAKWLNASGAGTGMVAGRFGGQAWRMAPVNAQGIDRVLPAATATLTIGIAVRLTALFGATPAAKSHISLTKFGSFFQCGIIFDAGGSITALRLVNDTSGTVLGSSAPGAMAANTWHYLEIEVVISTTVGRITVYVDGVQKLNVTGVNTATGGAGTTADTLHLASTNGGNGNGGFIDYDDIYVIDAAAKLGERRVETLRPSADTAQKDWAPDTGVVNFSRVNESVADAANYVQASVVGNLDLYDLADLSSTPAVIDAVQVTCFASKTDATARNIALVAKLGANSTQTADFVLPASAAKFEALLTAKPGGGSWSAADVNALQLGPKVTV